MNFSVVQKTTRELYIIRFEDELQHWDCIHILLVGTIDYRKLQTDVGWEWNMAMVSILVVRANSVILSKKVFSVLLLSDFVFPNPNECTGHQNISTLVKSDKLIFCRLSVGNKRTRYWLDKLCSEKFEHHEHVMLRKIIHNWLGRFWCRFQARTWDWWRIRYDHIYLRTLFF